jgi:hypothetical protein
METGVSNTAVDEEIERWINLFLLAHKVDHVCHLSPKLLEELENQVLTLRSGLGHGSATPLRTS